LRYFFNAAGDALTGLVEGLVLTGLAVFLAVVAVVGLFTSYLVTIVLTMDTLEAAGLFAVDGLALVSGDLA
jgi:hypothetical protein